jgi:hypothetical protein
MNVAKILKDLVEHKALIEAGIAKLEEAKQETGWLKVARGAIVTAIQNCESHAEKFPQTEPTATTSSTAPAPEPTIAPAAAAPEPTIAPTETVDQATAATNVVEIPKA